MRAFLTGFWASQAPKPKMNILNNNCPAKASRLGTANTFSSNSIPFFQPKVGSGKAIPKTTGPMIKKPSSTMVQSSANENFALDRLFAIHAK